MTRAFHATSFRRSWRSDLLAPGCTWWSSHLWGIDMSYGVFSCGTHPGKRRLRTTLYSWHLTRTPTPDFDLTIPKTPGVEDARTLSSDRDFSGHQMTLNAQSGSPVSNLGDVKMPGTASFRTCSRHADLTLNITKTECAISAVEICFPCRKAFLLQVWMRSSFPRDSTRLRWRIGDATKSGHSSYSARWTSHATQLESITRILYLAVSPAICMGVAPRSINVPLTSILPPFPS